LLVVTVIGEITGLAAARQSVLKVQAAFSPMLFTPERYVFPALDASGKFHLLRLARIVAAASMGSRPLTTCFTQRRKHLEQQPAARSLAIIAR